MTLPEWVRFEHAERTAAVMARQMSGRAESWGTLLAHAQAILDSHTDDNGPALQESYDFDKWQDLIAAARVVDQAATNNGLVDGEDRKTAATLAACSFGMWGAAVSATAVVKGHNLLESELTAGEMTALALSSPTLSRQIFTKLPQGSPYRQCVENIIAFLVTGQKRQIEEALQGLERATIEAADDWESYLLGLSRLSLAHLDRLATARVLEPYRARFPEGYVERLAADSPTLLPSQFEAIEKGGILERERNLLVSLPTGTGKTLLGELALMSALGNEPGLVCYVAPYVALGRQAAERIESHVPEGVRVTPLMGGYKEPSPLDPEARMEVLVATPERLDALIRLREDLMPWMRCIVFDEAHLVANDQRGIKLEGMITRLKLNSLRQDLAVRFIFLSAVLSNTDELARWIGIGDQDVIQGTWRPSAKRLLSWGDDGVLRLHAGEDPIRHTPQEVLGQSDLPWPNPNLFPVTHPGQENRQRPLELANVAYLAAVQLQQHQQPVLCVCASRAKTRQLASHIAQRLPVVEPTPDRVQTVVDLIEARHPYLNSLKRHLQHGVAYHNSTLPPAIRTGIERAVEDRELQVVVATTTLAEGVDLPFRVTILADWLMFDGERSTPIQSLLFKNIAGRCGRAGQFTEGDTIIFDNPVGDERYTQTARRKALQQEIFFSSSQPRLTSAVTRIEENKAVATIGSQLLAAIHENPDEDDLGALFLENSFAYQMVGRDGIAERRIRLAVSDILDEREGEPLAVAASPIRLTQFGEATRVTGLTPGTARRLRETLREVASQTDTNVNIVDACRAILEALGNVPEQTNSDLRRAVENPKSRPIVRKDELQHVINGWLSGVPLEEIFATTPSKMRSKHKATLRPWLNGTEDVEFWTDGFATFTEFVNNVLTFFLPWMLRSAESLGRLNELSDLPWATWGNFAEAGVDNTWGYALLDQDIIEVRSMARDAGRLIERLSGGEEVSLEQFQYALSQIVGISPDTMRRARNWFVAMVSEETPTLPPQLPGLGSTSSDDNGHG